LGSRIKYYSTAIFPNLQFYRIRVDLTIPFCLYYGTYSGIVSTCIGALYWMWSNWHIVLRLSPNKVSYHVHTKIQNEQRKRKEMKHVIKWAVGYGNQIMIFVWFSYYAIRVVFLLLCLYFVFHENINLPPSFRLIQTHSVQNETIS